ncbi:MAG: methionyl-tRNA formyltransferase [Eubacteriales bacterium]|nr:methionyl-tRNA formyltransferase [Lachnospiraceae bacterium]MDO5127622.1 methionyl-tRNA formyltransferase [Eubacteriales bacterium]
MRIVYMGTPDFAVHALSSLVDAGHEVVAVFTQPDKAKGRSNKLVPTPVKAKAFELGIPVYQPEKLKSEENIQRIAAFAPDVIVVAAYGQILPESILSIPPMGCINIHASLLPKYRGAAPIEWSIIDGEKQTGVTTMYMEKGLDTGDMLDVATVAIEPEDTAGTLHDKLAQAGAKLILMTLEKLADGTAVRTKQNDEESCYAVMLKKEMGNIDFTKSATEIERLIRGLNPWPCAYTVIDGKYVKLFRAQVVSHDGENITPGKIINITKKYFEIACGEDVLRILRLQPEGKKEMDAASYLNGNKLTVGMICG